MNVKAQRAATVIPPVTGYDIHLTPEEVKELRAVLKSVKRSNRYFGYFPEPHADFVRTLEYELDMADFRSAASVKE